MLKNLAPVLFSETATARSESGLSIGYTNALVMGIQ